MSELEKNEESSSITSNTVNKANIDNTDSKGTLNDANSTEESPMETIQLVEPEPVTITAEDMQMKPIEINDDDSEIEEKNDKVKNVFSNEECPPLPKRTSTASSLKKETNNTITSTMIDNTNGNPLLVQLKEAFPNIEEKYIITVIIASQGMIDPAFHALLYLSDPDSNKDIELPKVNTLNNRVKDTSQLKQDELLARQLDQQYNSRHQRHSSKHSSKNVMSNSSNDFTRTSEEDIRLAELRHQDRERRRHRPLTPEERREIYGDEDEDSWSHFVEKDIPEVANAVSTTFQETATKVSNWFNGVKNSWNSSQEDQYQSQRIRTPNRNNGFEYDQEQIRQQEEALRFYERQKRKQEQQEKCDEEKDLPKLPERRRFNSFGKRVGDNDVLVTHGIMLKNDEFSDNEDVPPQLPKRERKQDLNTADSKKSDGDDLSHEEANLSVITNENKVIPQTTFIDTPKDKATTKNWKTDELNSTPTKGDKTIDLNENIVINSDDEEL